MEWQHRLPLQRRSRNHLICQVILAFGSCGSFNRSFARCLSEPFVLLRDPHGDDLTEIGDRQKHDPDAAKVVASTALRDLRPEAVIPTTLCCGMCWVDQIAAQHQEEESQDSRCTVVFLSISKSMLPL